MADKRLQQRCKQVKGDVCLRLFVCTPTMYTDTTTSANVIYIYTYIHTNMHPVYDAIVHSVVLTVA